MVRKSMILQFNRKFISSLFALFLLVFCTSEWFHVYCKDQMYRITNQSNTLQGRDKGARKDKFFQKMEKADKGGLTTEYKKGELLVKFKDGVSESEAVSVHKGIGVSVRKKFKKAGVQLVQLPEGKDTLEAINDYKKTTKVKYAEPNYMVAIESTMPNDPMFSDLWGLHNTGQTSGTADADVDAPEAWDLFKGNSTLVVGVIDTGVDYLHSDLQANMWVNPFETADDGIDNDGNGFIDDVHGINAITSGGDPMDDHSHGTHVSGTIGAAGNNGEGVVGVNWHVKIMGLKFLNSVGSGWISDAIKCIEYVIDMKDKGVNIRVTNNSWGGGGYSSALYDAINELRSRGILFVAAAGNAGTDNDVTPRYPASYNLDNIIAVAATNHNDSLAPFSCYGAASVDLGAPGVSILSTLPSSVNCDYVCNTTLFFDNMESGGGNWTTGGTSNTWAITNEQSSGPGNAWSDSPYANYLNYTDSYFMLANNLDLSGVTDQVAISFHATYDLETKYDYLYVEVSGDGGATWQVIGTLNGSSPWSSSGFIVPSGVKTSQFRCRFRLKTDYSVVRDGVYIDDVRICTIVSTSHIYDNMESGGGNWTTGGTSNTWAITNEQSSSPGNAWSDSPYANYLNYTDSYFMLANNLDLSGVTDQVVISFHATYDLETNYDYLYVEVSGDGGATWQVIGTLNGSSPWAAFRFVVPSGVKTSQFRCRFRLKTDYSVVRDGVYIDDVSIRSFETTCETVNNYDWYSGTSMATPHVAGAAALIWSYSPSVTYLDVAGILLATVDPLASLNGRTVSGGRLNLYNALQQVNLLTHPVAHYAFEEGAGTVAGDSSGNGNDGTISGAAWTTGKNGGGLGFDGVNDYVTVPLINNDEVSVSAWFYKNANDTTRNDAIFSGFRNSSNPQLREGFELRFPSGNPNTLEFILVSQDGGGNRTTRTARRNLLNSVGSWYHVMGTYNKTTGQQRLYVNGELVHTVIHPAGNTAVPLSYYSDMRIGHSRINVGYFNGVIDDVRIYNQPLSDLEIHTMHNAFTGDLQASYTLDEGTGTVASDSSGNGNHGAVNGGATWTTGQNGGGLGFDGLDDYVTIPRINKNEISISAWFYKNANDTTRNDAVFGGFRNHSNTQLREGFELRFPSGNPNTLQFVLVTQDGGGVKTMRTAQRNLGNSVGSWYHVAGTYNKTTGEQRLYVNGLMVNMQTHPAGNTVVPLTSYSDMRIGYSRVNAGYFNGILDDIRLYKRTLTDQEVLDIYNGL